MNLLKHPLRLLIFPVNGQENRIIFSTYLFLECLFEKVFHFSVVLKLYGHWPV